MSDLKDIFCSLLSLKNAADARKFLRDVGDDVRHDLDEKFGPYGFCWHPVDGDVSNFSAIGVATKPGRSITERITNADDALLELMRKPNLPAPLSPRIAAKAWFGRPITGPEDGIYKWNFRQSEIDRNIHLVLVASEIDDRTTIDALDFGTGIAPEHFQRTILSIHGKNKITKKYLIGTFGQGGASTLGFCDYCIIVSRAKERSGEIGFTIIKLLKLGDEYKEDTYVYLAIPKGNGEFPVPSTAFSDPELTIYDNVPGLKLPTLRHGTLVRHIAFSLPKLDSPLSPSVGNLYHYLNCSLFDPLLPFRLVDLRVQKKERDEVITGSRNRLMRLTNAKKEDPENELASGSTIRHHRQMEYVAPYGSTTPSIGIEYWVVFNHRKQGEQIILRPRSNEIYVQPNHPIIFSLHGQNQGELSGQILRDLNLEMLSRHMIVHVDATLCDSATRKGLFATTREALRDGPVLESLLHVLNKMIEEDKELYLLEKELTEQLINRELETTETEVKKQVADLLRDAGLQVEETGEVSVPGGTEQEKTNKKHSGDSYFPQEPLPTKPFPQVTYFEIVSPKGDFEIQQKDSKLLSIETDADSEFDEKEFIQIRCEPKLLTLASKRPLSGGRMRFRMRAYENAVVGAKGVITATLTMPGGKQIIQARNFTVIPAVEKGSKKEKGRVPPFEIIFISPDNPTWLQVWPDSETEEDQRKVAYKAMKSAGHLNVYVSKVFPDYENQVTALKTGPAWRLSAFNTQYKVWIGYHAIIQDQGRKETAKNLEEKDADRVLEIERVRVAKMQVRQALKAADMQHALASKK